MQGVGVASDINKDDNIQGSEAKSTKKILFRRKLNKIQINLQS